MAEASLAGRRPGSRGPDRPRGRADTNSQLWGGERTRLVGVAQAAQLMIFMPIDPEEEDDTPRTFMNEATVCQ
jgi:hypothetical protein